MRVTEEMGLGGAPTKIALLALALAGLLAALAAFLTTDRIVFGVSVAGQRLGGLRPTEAKERLEARREGILNEGIEFVFERKHLIVPLRELGAEPLIEEAVSRALRVGRSLTNLPPKKISLRFRLERGRFEETVLRMEATLGLPGPTDAKLALSEGKAVILEEKPGEGIAREALLRELEALLGGNERRPIRLETRMLPPHRVAADLTSLQAEAARILEQPLTLLAGEERVAISPRERGDWLAISEEGGLHLVLDEAKIHATLDRLARRLERQAQPRRLQGSEVIDEGEDGLHLDRQAAVREIRAALERGEREVTLTTRTIRRGEVQLAATTEPEVEPAAPAEAPRGSVGGKAIEIVLSAQRLYLYEQGERIAEHPVSTGKWSTPTPIGEFRIEGKYPKAYSRRYRLFMPYWMAITPNGLYGIHELPIFRNGRREGASHLGRPASNGCIRLGIGAAEAVYNWAEIGTPVVIRN